MTVRDGLRALFGSTTAAVSELTTTDALIRTPLPLSRRVGVVALQGGSGTSTVAAALVGLVGRRRTGPVLAVDAAGGAAGLARDSDSAADRQSDADAATVRAGAATLTQARTGLTEVTGSGVSLLDLAQPERRPASAEHWRDEVSPIARFFDLVVTDWGVRPAAVDLLDVATSSHVLVVVARADRHPAGAAAGAVAAVRAAVDVSPVLVLVDVTKTADRVAPALRRELEIPVHVLPYERSLAVDPDRRLSGRARLARIRLAATVLAGAVSEAVAT